MTAPRDFTDDIAALLRPGGILVLRTPNINSAVAKLAGARWEWLSPPDHICMFSAQSIGSLLRASGFGVLRMQTAHGNTSNAWYEVLRSWALLALRPKSISGQPKVSLAAPRLFAYRRWHRTTKFVIEMGSKPIDCVVSPPLARLGTEAELVVVARKLDKEATEALNS